MKISKIICSIFSIIFIIYGLFEIIHINTELNIKNIIIYNSIGIIFVLIIFKIHKISRRKKIENNSIFIANFIHTFIHASLVFNVLFNYINIIYFIFEELFRIFTLKFSLHIRLNKLFTISIISIISAYILKIDNIQNFEYLNLYLYYITIPILLLHIKDHS